MVVWIPLYEHKDPKTGRVIARVCIDTADLTPERLLEMKNDVNDVMKLRAHWETLKKAGFDVDAA